MSDKVTVDISPIANNITVAPITTSVEISQNTTTVELKSVTYENNISQTVTNVDITPTTTTVEATVNTTTVDISPNTTTVGVGDASIVASNLASATNTSHDSNSWITGGNVQASFDNLATTADSRYVNVTGDTMTGNLTVPRLKVERDNGTAVISLHDNTDDDDHVIYLTGMVDNTPANIFSLGTNDTTNQFQLHSWLDRDFEFTFGSDKHVDAVATISTSGLDVAGNIITDKVGIGTSTPSNQLTLKSTSAGNTSGVRWENETEAVNAYFKDGNADTDFYITYIGTNGPEIKLQHDGDIILNSGSDGKVGIGRDNPSTTLDVNGTVTATAFSGPLTGNVTGQVSDLSNHTFFSGSYDDLDDKPALFDGAYNSLTGKPTLFSGSYNDLDDKPTLVTSIGGLSDVDITTNAPTNDQVLVWSTNKFVPADQSAAGVDLTAFSVGDDATASGSGGIGYNNSTGVFTYTPPVLSNFLTSETTTSLALESNVLKYTDEEGTENQIDISLYLDDTNLARLTSGTLDSSTGTATFTRSDNTTFNVDFSSLINSAEVNDLTASVTWANVPNANITESSVTQHQTALSITESQISDLGSYITDYTVTEGDVTAHQAALSITESQISDLGSYITDYTVTEGDVTAHQAALSITESQISDLGSYITDYTVTEGDVTAHQAALSITESQISDLGSYLTSETSHDDVLVDGDFTSNGFMKRTGDGQYTIDSSTYITDYTVTEGDVTSHQAALSITESQISDLGTYLTNIDGQDLKDLADVSYSGTPRNHSLLVYNPLVTGGGTNPDKWTVGTNVAIDSIESDLSPNSTQATYQVYKTLVDESGSSDLAYLTIGGAPSGSYGNSNNLFDRVELRAGSDGIRMHWYENSEQVAGQTERFHTTSTGIHVGDDRIGTYTAGDLMQNADLDYGMLVGRESTNTGSNNFGFGYKHSFGTGTASNMAVGSLHQCNVTGSENNFFAGGENRLTTSGDHNFCGGVRTSTRNHNNFTWAEGVIGDNNIRYAAENFGTGCALFGKQTKIDGNSAYSLVGGRLDPTSFTETEASDLDHGILWGQAVRSSNADGSINVGNDNYVHNSHGSACFGQGHVVGNQSQVRNYMFVAGKDHYAEGSQNVCLGDDNNTFGVAAAAIGKSLKTPLFQDVINGSLVSTFSFDDYSVVVGAYNDATEKYLTDHTNTPAQTWITDHRFVVGTGTSASAKANGFVVTVSTDDFSGIIMPALAASNSHSSGSVAKSNGVPVGGLYHTNGVVKVVLDSD